MDNMIRPSTMPTVGLPAPGAGLPAAGAVPPGLLRETPPVAQDSVRLGTSQPSPTPPQTVAPEAPAQSQAPAAPVQPPENPQGFVNVPVTLAVPIELVTPDANGNIPLSQYTPDLRPPNAIYTTQEDVQELVETVKRQTLPPGTHAEIDTSAAAHRVEVGQKTFAKVANSIGGMATYSLARPSAHLTIPSAVAAPVALVAGGLNIYTGLEQSKQSLNLKGYYEGLKKEGVEVLPMQVPVKTKEGLQMQQVEVPLDNLIGSAKNSAIVGGTQALSGAFMIGSAAAMLAALPAAPALAVGAIVLNIAGPLYASREQLAMVVKAAWEKIKEKLHIGAQEAQQQGAGPTISALSPAPPAAGAPTPPVSASAAEQPRT